MSEERTPDRPSLEDERRGRRTIAITILIIALVAVGYVAVLYLGGNLIPDAPFAQAILRARERFEEIISFEPPRSLPPALADQERGAIRLTPSPVVALNPTPVLSPVFRPPAPDAPSLATFTIDYENTTGVRLTGVTITNDIPAGANYRTGSASPEAQFDGRRLLWNLGTLEVGETGSVRFQVVTSRRGRLINRAVMSSNEAPDAVIENSVNVS